MKVGDYVGWEDSWSDEEGCTHAGLIVRYENNYDREYYDILNSTTGKILIDIEKEEIVVMFESN